MNASAMGRSNRSRGARAERRVVEWLRENGWPDARRYLAGDGRQPGDIDAWPGICIEVKDVAVSSWPTWIRQALNEANGRIPIVVRRTRGNSNVAEWECRLYAHDAEVELLIPTGSLTTPPRQHPANLRVVSTTFGAVAEAVRQQDQPERTQP